MIYLSKKKKKINMSCLYYIYFVMNYMFSLSAGKMEHVMFICQDMSIINKNGDTLVWN